MSAKPLFEELDFSETPLGDLILRRRTILSLDNKEIFEVILGDGYLMSSLFTVVEEELAWRGLKAIEADPLNVIVGGLGLGYTAAAALDCPRLASLHVIDIMEPVIRWHRSELLPLGARLNADERCEFVQGDFFELATTTFIPSNPAQKYHAVLLDIDHSPDKLLHERHGSFYSAAGLQKMADQMHPGGVFGLWSDDPPEDQFFHELEQVFDSVDAQIVEFHNPLQNKNSASTIYFAQLAR